MATSKYLREQTRQEDPYIFDNAQDRERQRVDEQSRALNILMHDNPIHCPVSNPLKILEIGYGTGLMCNLLAHKFPHARVYGIDPSPTPVGFREKPQNVEYIQAKYEDLLEVGDPPLEQASFDYIFVRMAVCWVTDWPSHITRIMSLLKPGAWAELQDVSLFVHFSGHTTDPVDKDWEWARVLREDCLGTIDCSSGLNLESRMKSSGFNDVKSVSYPFCLGKPWPEMPETQPIAEYSLKHVPPVCFGLLDRTKYSAEEIQQMKDSMMEYAFSGKIDRLHWKFHVCIGRKPE